MRVNDVFSRIHDRQIEGTMMHHALDMYFEFAGLSGFADMQGMRNINEQTSMVKLEKYFIKHYNMLLNANELTIREYAPESWYEHSRYNFNKENTEIAVKNFLETWLAWEKDSKKVYEVAYGDLFDLREFSGAIFVKNMICEVDYELAFAEQIYLELLKCDFDIIRIQDINQTICEKYECVKKSHKYLKEENND